MIDIHSHILFGVDDGANSLRETKEMLTVAYKQGVKTIVATPHQRKRMFETSQEVINEQYKKLCEVAQEVADDLEILLGSEVYISQGTIQQLEQHKFKTIADTNAVLIEFAYDISYKELLKTVKSIVLLGYQVVIAHIERYDALEGHAEYVEELIELGCYIQVNAASLLPIRLFDKHKQRKKRARYFLDEDVVHFIASDAHNLTTRPYYMTEAYQFLVKQYGRKRANTLCQQNQEKLLNKEEI